MLSVRVSKPYSVLLICLIVKMPVTVETCYSVSLDDSPAWKFDDSRLVEVQERQYVKVNPNDIAFVKLVCHGEIELSNKLRPSLSGCAGYKALMKARNDAMSTPCMQQEHEAEAALFDDVSPPKLSYSAKRKAQKANALKSHQLRQQREPLTVVLGCDSVASLQPTHPCENMYVAFDPSCIETLVLFIRQHGLDLDHMTDKRDYGRCRDLGMVKNGTAGYIKIRKATEDSGSGGEGDGPAKRKYTRVKVGAQDDPDPLSDADEVEASEQLANCEPLADKPSVVQLLMKPSTR